MFSIYLIHKLIYGRFVNDLNFHYQIKLSFHYLIIQKIRFLRIEFQNFVDVLLNYFL